MARIGKAILLAAAAVVMIAGRADSQLYYQPQPPPLVTAENEPWFLSGEAITHEGLYYFPAGPLVYFDGNRMVRSGAYRGVPIYADTTQEAYSIVLVPVARGLMQPYERRRTGDAAGGTGTQAPSFPVDIAGERRSDSGVRAQLPSVPGPPVWSVPDDLRFAEQFADTAEATRRRVGPEPLPTAPRGGAVERAVPTAGVVPLRHVLEAGRKPKGLNEVYVTHAGYRWRSAGMAVPMRDEDYEVAGDYKGFPVYVAIGEGKGSARIWLKGRPGFIAPYERAGGPVRY